MLYWSRRTFDARLIVWVAVASGTGLLLVSGPTQAQEYYIQPRADIGVEVDSNRDLVSSGPKSAAEGNDVRVGATIGIATPESETTLRPQFDYYDYPTLHESSVRTVLDFASSYTGQRTQAGIFGRVDYADLYSSELPSAQFNAVNPNLPTTPETARISEHGTRTLLIANPSYQYDLTQRLGLQASGVLQSISYNNPAPPTTTTATTTTTTGSAYSPYYIAYDYYYGAAGLDWKLSPRSDIALDGDVSREQSKNIFSVTDGHGVTLTYNYQWSKVFTGSLQILAEEDDIHAATLPPSASKPNIDTTSSGIGAQYTTTWKGEISQLQLTVGRTFTPSGAGGKFKSDALQVEYKRQFTQRISLDAAAHYIRNVAESEVFASGDYDYLQSTADLKWMVTRTWYLAGGLEYLYTRSPGVAPPNSAGDYLARISFGYEGLGRQY